MPLSVMVGHARPSWHRHLGLTMYSPGLAVMSLQYWVALHGGSWNNIYLLHLPSKATVNNFMTYRETEVFNLDDGVWSLHAEVVRSVEIVVTIRTHAFNIISEHRKYLRTQLKKLLLTWILSSDHCGISARRCRLLQSRKHTLEPLVLSHSTTDD